VGPYLATARRFRLLFAAILLVVWGAGIGAAANEWAASYQADATVWVIRPAPELSANSGDDPNVSLVQTAASQQAEVLKQLLQTRSFLADVVARTSLLPAYQAATDQKAFLDQIRKRFRVDTLGSSLIRVSYVGHDPRSPSELITAAFAIRAERLSQARTASSAALGTLYQRQIEFSEAQIQDAQKALDQFNQTHSPPLNDADQHLAAQLRLNVDYAVVALQDLQGRRDRAVLGPAILEVSGLEFQVVDEPRVATEPSGGERAALTIAFVALAAGAALVLLFTLLVTLLGSRLSRSDRAVAAPRIAAVGGRRSSSDAEIA
jgi:uncharacterized protein involved in exopolysaccharide biosynthesis